MDAGDWDRRYHEKDLLWSLEPNRFVVEELADCPPGRVLDLAAGEGRNAIWLAAQGHEVEAVEFSAVAIERAAMLAERRGVRLRLTTADLTLQPEVAPADVVLLCYLQLPRAEERRVLRHAAGLVRDGGTLLVVSHARRNLSEGVGGPQDPAVLPTVPEVLDALADTGLVVERAEEVLRPVEGEDRAAVDLIVRAARPA